MFKITIDFKGVIELIDVIPQASDFLAEDFVERAGLALHRTVKKGAPVDTGRLRSDIHLIMNLKGRYSSASVGTEVFYAPFVEYGTKPHFPPPIALEKWVRRKGISGRFAGSGDQARADRTAAFVIARAISKRGTKAQPFFGPAVEQLEEEAADRLAQSFQRAKKRFKF